MNMKFFMLGFFLFFIYITPINAERGCVFDYIKVEGNFICEINCSGPIIKIKENSDLCITPLNSDIKIYYRPTTEQNKPPEETLRKSLSDTLCIMQPTYNFGYNYWVASRDIPIQSLRIQVITYKEFEECIQKTKDEQKKLKSPLPPVKQASKQEESSPSTNNCNVYISGNKGQVTIGDISCNQNQSSDDINIIKDIILPIITGTIVFIVTKLFIDKYFLNRKKNKKTKKQKPKP